MMDGMSNGWGMGKGLAGLSDWLCLLL